MTKPAPTYSTSCERWTTDLGSGHDDDHDAEQPAVARAGPDQTTSVGNTVTLNGSASSDVDGNPLTFAWSITSRPAGSAAVLSNPAAVMPTFVADVSGRYVAQLIVNDGTVNSMPDTVVINTGNSPPVASAGPDRTVIVTSLVTLNGSGSSDVDGDALTLRGLSAPPRRQRREHCPIPPR